MRKRQVVEFSSKLATQRMVEPETLVALLARVLQEGAQPLRCEPAWQPLVLEDRLALWQAMD
jgi:hypothetical protein